MKSQEARNLWDKYMRGECSAEESAMLESWYNKEFANLEEPETLDYLEAKNQIWQEIRDKQKSRIEKKAHRLWFRIAAAASVIIVIGFGYYFYAEKINLKKAATSAYAEDILPGGNNAVLTLANGEKIHLEDGAKGERYEQSGISVTKTADGQVIYQVLNSSLKTQSSTAYNTLETPAGGQHQIILQDGSKVWLNASSSLRFPVTFGAARQRIVTLIGQGYFEVAKDKKKPFIVETNKQRVEVLGTHFDINAYPDDASIKTTLLEGSVRISPGTQHKGDFKRFTPQLLKPNQQAVLSDKELDIVPVEANDVIAWKNGKFMFNNEELESIMKKVSRWYNVDVRYVDDNMKKNIYWGAVSRFGNVSKVLKMLETTGDVHFRIEGKTIVVMP